MASQSQKKSVNSEACYDSIILKLPPTKSEDKVIIRVDDLRLKEKVTT